MYKKGLAISIIVLFIGVSFQPIIAENTISVVKESNSNVDFEDAKEYLFQIIIDISINPDVKNLFEQLKYDQKIFTSDYDYKSAFLQILFKKPRLLKSILFTRPKMTCEYLETNYNKGLEIIDILGIEETSKMMESVKITNPDLFNEFKIIIENDKDLSNRISVLEEVNNNLKSNLGFQNNSTICNILYIIFIPIGLGTIFSAILMDWAMYRDNQLLYNIAEFLFILFLNIAVFIGAFMLIFDCPL